MGKSFSSQKEALSMAIEMEKEGQSFYRKTADKASDKMTKQVFEFLAGEEMKHIEAIKNFYDSEIAGQSSDFNEILGSYTPEKTRRAILGLFKGLGEKAPVDKPDMEAYSFARDFEKNGENFYREAASKATDENVKKLFEFLVEEEVRHFQMIDDSMAFLENPSEWFHRQEKWHVEG
ncbi:MAG: ferritin family protein [candidate division Zixibacteria bacterium]|nr:ferritin family protein [candidate division Zixibacteria bacterium]